MLINQCKKFMLSEHEECLLSECTAYTYLRHTQWS